MKQRYSRILAMLLLSLTAWSAQAHKVNMFATVEGDNVFLEGYFLDGKKPKNCAVTVYDSNGKELLTGMTNDEGQFTFKNPATGLLRVKLDAGEGHLKEITLTADELGLDDGGAIESSSAVATPETESETSSKAVANQEVVSNVELETLVKRAVGQSIRPMIRELDMLKERRGMSDIMGGIGIIMGVGGLLLYLQARKLAAKSRSESE